ncbi:hypothetical protein N803_01785 [Knoellia subterranea KCTC 19937]|uniref:Uncharacterized protein n=1 Tax=Knoellia subterranea KCTC 19937 TaxID=1385521 RepID=A0A0A0JUA0_9MICO|nr:hypothetical protein N803_01785 [Knoellia subterranea KCTC 19937]
MALVVQFVLLYAPSSGGAPPFPHFDKLVHAAIFALPVFFAAAARLPFVPVVALAAAHAPLSEVIQGTLLPQRSGDPRDVIADLVGVALGVIAAQRVLRVRESNSAVDTT